ncbi:MAG TPA: serine hydrolase domain-containing protein [Dyella sp.]|uniref:serine hydrolase domain-containing protein n=1 Tax=Dyella sp. TaxID=1869338 RepID=UPI002F94D715
MRIARLMVCAAALSLSGCVGIAIHLYKYAHKKSATQPAAAPTAADPSANVRAALESAVKDGAPGVTAIVMRGDTRLLRMDVGTIDPNAQWPVASASKWLTAALVMNVVDEGKLSLDVPISRYLPAFKGQAGEVTLRQLLAQTSGEGSLEDGLDIRQDPRMTLAQSAEEVARQPLVDAPGTVFKYGGPGFQVAGAAVEAVTGKRWADLFQERIAVPLGMTHTYWTHIPANGATAAQTRNPLLQGGAVMTAEDYMRFLGMLAHDGMANGHRVLSHASVEAMETVQTDGKPEAYMPPGVKGSSLQYGLGNWCESWDANLRCQMVSSAGAFGTYPWIDRKSGLYGIFFTRARLTKIEADYRRARVAILAAYGSK